MREDEAGSEDEEHRIEDERDEAGPGAEEDENLPRAHAVAVEQPPADEYGDSAEGRNRDENERDGEEQWPGSKEFYKEFEKMTNAPSTCPPDEEEQEASNYREDRRTVVALKATPRH